MTIKKTSATIAAIATLTVMILSGRSEAGMKVHNGLSAVNGMKIHNGLSAVNGMKIHNGLSAGGAAAPTNIWIANGINPGKALSSSIKGQ